MEKIVAASPIDISKEKILMEYHNILYRLTGIPMDFTATDGECFRLCPEQHINPICRLIRSCPAGMRKCEASDSAALSEARMTRKGVIYTCHAGLIDIAVPIIIDKVFIGCVTAGQILAKRPTTKTFNEFLENIAALELDASPTDLRSYFFHTPYLDEQKLQAIVDLISLVSNYIIDSQNKLLFFEKIHEKDKISVIRRYIESNYKKKIDVEKAAGTIFLSPSRFSHLFKKEVGVSFVQYLNQFRIEKAKELLCGTRLGIAEIAQETGFQNLTHFNRIFKKKENMSPQALRKSRKGQ